MSPLPSHVHLKTLESQRPSSLPSPNHPPLPYSIVTKVEQKVIDEQLDGEDPVLKAKKDRFNIEKELELIGCGNYAEGLKKIGFGERGAFSFLREEHITGNPLFVHGKAKRKIVGLASAYRRQLQYEEQQVSRAAN